MILINKRMIPFLLTIWLIASMIPLGVYAEDGVPSVLTYQYTDDAPIVPASELFLSLYEGEYDIRIEGTRTVFTFFYENVFRSTAKWRDFSSSVSVYPISEAEQHDSVKLKRALENETAFLLDFADGDVYPGTASVEIALNDILPPEQSYLVYEVKKSADGEARLRPIADGMRLSDRGTLAFTLTEAHDFLLVARSDTAEKAVSAFLYTPVIPTSQDGLFSGVSVGWIVFFTVIGVLLAVWVLYFVIVSVMKKKRRSEKQKSLPKKK